MCIRFFPILRSKASGFALSKKTHLRVCVWKHHFLLIFSCSKHEWKEEGGGWRNLKYLHFSQFGDLWKQQHIVNLSQIFLNKQIKQFYKLTVNIQRTIIHKTYTMSAKRHNQKERTQKTTSSLSKNPINLQNHLKT